MLSASDFFNIDSPIASDLFFGTEYVWEGLENIKSYLDKNLEPNITTVNRTGSLVTEDITMKNGAFISAGAYLVGDDIYIGKNTVVEPGAFIKGPAIIYDNCEIRHCCYIRGQVIIGNSCVVGHTTEMKHSVMLGNSKAGHFAYIGDSILGAVNLGAGTKLANLKITGSEVIIRHAGKEYKTGLRKMGAIMGDGTEMGCNSVTAPGTLISKKVLIYPLAEARGYYETSSIVKLRQSTELERY